jgi:hypothetical protein
MKTLLLMSLVMISACGGKVSSLGTSTGTATQIETGLCDGCMGTGTGGQHGERTSGTTCTGDCASQETATFSDADAGQEATLDWCSCDTGGVSGECTGTGTDTMTFRDGGCSPGQPTEGGTLYVCFFDACGGSPACAGTTAYDCALATATGAGASTSTATMTGIGK